MIQFICDFNSTMVRLKVARTLPVNTASLFQFHYGTIKRQSQARL